MPYYIISGKPDCIHYNHAVHVAEYLSDKLPNFYYKKIEKGEDSWPGYLDALNKEHHWCITESPLIWKELSMWGGRKYLMGGLSEFWEHVYCYYGLESTIPRKDLMILGEDNLRAIPVAKGKTTNITLFDRTSDEKTISGLNESAAALNEAMLFSTEEILTVAADEDDSIKDADIYIHLYDFRRQPDESEDEWLYRCFFHMEKLAGAINLHAKRSMKIILSDHGPVCFMATVLVELCMKLKPSNIVSVTADLGLSTISAVSQKCGVTVDQISAPPVWGFVGINSFVDVRNIVFKAYMYKPFKSSLTAPPDSTLPLGTMKAELRLLSYLLREPTFEEEIEAEVQRRKETAESTTGHPFLRAKFRSIISLVKLWTNSDHGDQVISLGVCSNGSFDIRRGIVFSQPVMLDKRGSWVPFGRFPLLNNVTKSKIKECVTEAELICRKIGLAEEPSTSDYMSLRSSLMSIGG